MKRILLTGMSGTGKSSVIEALSRQGYPAIDTDTDEWSEWTPGPEPDWVWREDRIHALLEREFELTLFVAGCKSNQGKFYPHFDAVVLLSAPAATLLERVRTRMNNPYGKARAEQDQILHNLLEIEPLLRQGCTFELNTAGVALDEVVNTLLERVGASTPAVP